MDNIKPNKPHRIVYNAPEIAKILKKSKVHIYELIKEGRLKSSLQTSKGKLLFTMQDFLNYLAKEKAKKNPDKPKLGRPKKPVTPKPKKKKKKRAKKPATKKP